MNAYTDYSTAAGCEFDVCRSYDVLRASVRGALPLYENDTSHWRRKRGARGGACAPHFSEWGAKICLCPPTFRPRI